jgi:hypothetical protein
VGGKVVVKLNEGEHIPGEGVVLLKRRSRLKAFNPQDPVMEECWKGVFSDNQLVAGTKLIYVSDLMDRSGAHAGYVAVAPQGARGFILQSDVRDTTAEEIAARGQEQGRLADLAEERQMEQPIRRRADVPVIGRDGAIEPERKTAPERVAAADDAGTGGASEEIVAMEETIQGIQDSMEAEAEEIAAQDAAQDEVQEESGGEELASGGADSAPEAVDDAPIANDAAGSDEPAEQEAVDAAPEQIAEDSREPAYAEEERAEPEQSPATAAVPAARRGRVMTLAELDAAYERVVSRAGESPEYGVLIEEYNRHASRLIDEPESERTRSYIATRVQLLEIAAELARGDAELAALSADAEYAGTEMVAVAERVRASRGFDLVGRLVSSAVYDGERLPMLYRLVSVEGRVGRTVAYLTDESALGMDGKLGSVVGVRGEGEPGEVGLVRVIRPAEVTVLTGVAGAGWDD